MGILLWLAPAVVATVIAAGWVSWLGREGRGEVDPEVAAARLARALEKDFTPRYAAPAPAPQRGTGVAVRPARAADPHGTGAQRPRRAS